MRKTTNTASPDPQATSWVVIGYDHPIRGRTYSSPLPEKAVQDMMRDVAVSPGLLSKHVKMIGIFPKGTPEYDQGKADWQDHPNRENSPWKNAG